MSQTKWLFSLAEVTAKLSAEAEPMRYVDAARHGTMTLGLYAPRGPDLQKPHDQDELYVIAAGSGVFDRNGDRRPLFRPGCHLRRSRRPPPLRGPQRRLRGLGDLLGTARRGGLTAARNALSGGAASASTYCRPSV